MSSRSTSLRTKVVALLLSLVALWAFAATVTLREGLNLFGVSTLGDNVGRPVESLLTELQAERRLTLVYLGGRSPAQRAALIGQRERTDKARREFRELTGAAAVESAATDVLEQRLADLTGALDGLERGRLSVDGQQVDRTAAVVIFTDIIDSGFRVYNSMSTLDDDEIAKESRTLIGLSRAREVLAQEDATLAGAIAAGRLTVADQQAFMRLIGAQRFLYSEAAAELRDDDRERLDAVFNGTSYLRFRALEDRVVADGRVGLPVPVRSADWDTAARVLIDDLRKFELAASEGTIERAAEPAMWVLIRLLLAGGLGLIAVIASIIVSITTARSLVRQLEKLRNAARDLANERLPRVVDRLQRGEQVDVEAEAPPLSFGVDEIGQVGRAFNDVQATAVRVAVEQAELRQGVRDVFLSLARRSQALVHRQLTLLDTMERRTSEPEELENLFRIDHLATRMRRNAENLIVLSGAVPGRGWRNPIPIVDVVRGAVAEVEEYERVTIAPVGSAALAGRAVGDVIHLLAELIENALSFSPPHTMVHVSGQLVGNGYAVEIEDRGLGMSDEDIDEANERLENPPEFNLSSTARLGLYVVGRLAERHRLKVRVRSSPYGGVTAVVLIPMTLVVHGEAPSTAAAIAAGRRDRGVPRERNTQRDRLRDATLHRGLTPVEATPTKSAPSTSTPNASAPTASTTEMADDHQPALASDTVVIDRDAVTVMAPPVADPVRDVAPAQADDLVEEPVRTEEPRRYGATTPAAEPVSTPSGLPRRVRQASLAAPLRESTQAETEPAPAPARPPEEVRRMMSSYQQGMVQGRVEAEDAPVDGPDDSAEDSPGPNDSAESSELTTEDGSATEAGISQNSGDR